MKRFKQKKQYTPKRIYAFSNIETYLKRNKEYAEKIYNHLNDNFKIAQKNQIYPKTPEYIPYILKVSLFDMPKVETLTR